MGVQDCKSAVSESSEFSGQKITILLEKYSAVCIFATFFSFTEKEIVSYFHQLFISRPHPCTRIYLLICEKLHI